MEHPDFIIIGSGIAGLNFALNVAEFGRVLVITKKSTVQSSTNRAQGGIAAVLDKADDFEAHVKDTIVAGANHNDRGAVEFMVKNGPAAIRRLIEFGVEFAHHDGEIVLTREGGHGARRIAFVGDYTGKEIESALVKNVSAHPNIEIWEHATAIDLLVDKGSCRGVRIMQGSQIENLYAGAVIIATGGVGQLYTHTTNPRISTGDGLAMGIRAGITTQDLEFIQFHPTGLAIPRKKSFLLSEALRGEGAYLVNENGERFMKAIHDMAELAPRDIVARAIYKQLQKSKVYLDMRHLDATHTRTRFPKIYSTLKSHGLDITGDLIPIAPAAHYICGGLKVDKKGRTCIKNVYAFGEVTHTGVHGANRLASNSLLEALVYSNQIAQELSMCTLSQKIKKNTRQHTPTYKGNSQEENKFIAQKKHQLKKIMWKYVGIIRTPQKLQTALKKITKLTQQINDRFPQNITNEKISEIRNMLTCAEAITNAALTRTKSLGTHYITKQ